MSSDLSRPAVRTGVRLETLTVVWMLTEAAVALLAGITAGSVLLIAFGFDSIIELASGSVLLWRLFTELRGGDTEPIESIEHRATQFVAVTLVLLCVYVLLTSIVGLATHATPEPSPAGIAIAAAAVIVMPWLGLSKRRVAAQIESSALRGDAAESFTCGYMAATVLVGLVLNAALHWWWAEYIAAIGFLGWLLLETREAVEEARGATVERTA